MDFIYGDNYYLLTKKIDELVSLYKIKPLIFNEDSKIEDIWDEVATVSFFDYEKLIIIKNHKILLDQKNPYIKQFIDIIKNGLDIKIIFVLYNQKINYKNEFIKYLIYHEDVYKCINPTANELRKEIEKIVIENHGTIEFEAINMIIDYLPFDLKLIELEIKKILLTNKNIDSNLLKSTIVKDYEQNIFAFPNSLIENNPSEIITTYSQRKSAGDDAFTFISQISSLYILANNIWELKQEGKNLNDISKKLKIHIFRIKKANKLLLNNNIEKIEKVLKELIELEKNIKNGSLNQELGFNYWLLNFIKNS